jgi:hypothetical protein
MILSELFCSVRDVHILWAAGTIREDESVDTDRLALLKKTVLIEIKARMFGCEVMSKDRHKIP